MNFKPLKHYSLVMFFILFGALTPALADETSCKAKNIVVLGDSLVAGYGLAPGEAYPEQLSEKLKSEGYSVQITNAGVSGDTTSGGLARLDWSIAEGIETVILELGANDGLRGIPVERTRENLEQIIEKLQARNITLMLAGMRALPNMGKPYQEAFDQMFPQIAEKYDLIFYPFFLEGVAAIPDLNQSDAIHPTAEGISLIVEKSFPTVLKLINSRCKAE